jgi:hypothetical protein
VQHCLLEVSGHRCWYTTRVHAHTVQSSRHASLRSIWIVLIYMCGLEPTTGLSHLSQCAVGFGEVRALGQPGSLYVV